jgi:hypothetical protein
VKTTALVLAGLVSIVGCASEGTRPPPKPTPPPTPDAAVVVVTPPTETAADAAPVGGEEPTRPPTTPPTTPDAAPPPGDAPPPPPSTAPEIQGCTIKWSPSAMRDGDKAFELPEMPDLQLPGGSAPTHGGVKHLTAVAEHDAFRIDSHYDTAAKTVDYDRVTQTGPTRTDRLRCEVRGMVGPSGQVDMVDGQTWRMQWSLFIPASLVGTSRFTHIFQLKFVDKGGGASGSPIITLTLRPDDKIELLLWLGGGSVATTSLAGLHDRWLTSDLTVKVAAKGSVHWTFSDGTKTLVDKEQAGVTWPAEAARARPKWGIYRGIADGVRNTYLLLSDMRAYQCQ